MQEGLQKNMEYSRKRIESVLKGILKKHEKSVQDIYLFGSATRGKKKPKDLDLLVLFRNDIDLETVSSIRKALPKGEGSRFELTPLTYAELLSPTFRPRADILSDAVSVRFGTKLCNCFGYESYSTFLFSLENFSNSERVKFHYALAGRGKKSGLLERIGAFRIADGALCVPVKNSCELNEFLEHWRIKHTEIKLLAESRLERLVRYKK